MDALVGFIERQLVGDLEIEISTSTPLFEGGLVNSLRVLELMAFIETATGERIPHRMVVMKHFRTVDAIGRSFWPEENGEVS